MSKNDIIKQIEELEKEIHELLYHVVGMSYNTEKALKLKKKIKEIKEKENGQE